MLNSNKFRLLIGSFGLIFLILSLFMLFVDLRSYKQANLAYPIGSSISGVPLGGLNHDEAYERLEFVFTQPVELRYNGARMHFNPVDLGLTLNIDQSLAMLENETSKSGYWSHLWGKASTSPVEIPLAAETNESVLREFLASTILLRYDQPATAHAPIIYTTNFEAGVPGFELDIDSSISLVKAALLSPSSRIVDLPISESSAKPLDWENLKTFLKQTVLLEGFDGLVEIYINDLQDTNNLHFAYFDNQEVVPDIAYSAASTIKIPIMLSTFNRLGEPTPENAQFLMERMIVYSENPPTDDLMANYIDPIRGPLSVTQDLQMLGYQNSFLAGFFYVGAPVLELFKTPANTRTDVFLDPDVYNQTVPSEIGDLLTQVYYCANPGLTASKISQVFQGAVSSNECQGMIELLSNNKIGLLIESGLPPQASVAHKHGWTQDLDGTLRTMSDVGIVTSPGGDYVLVIFMHKPDQLLFSEGNWLFAKLSQTIYNAFNIENQAYWWIEE